MKVSILGSTGSMGRLVIKTALRNGCAVANKVSSRDRVSSLFDNADVIIDFSCPMATEDMLTYSKNNKIKTPIVVGTTGLSDFHIKMIKTCSAYAPIFCSPNMSFGVAIMNMVVFALAKLLDPKYDVEVFDKHHRLKKDAPSGTALMLGKTVAKARGKNFADVANFVRYGIINAKKEGEIGFAVQRCGCLKGIHEVSFVGEKESVSVVHQAYSKEIFAQGAIDAARWLQKQGPGMYDMNDFTKSATVSVVRDLYKSFFVRDC
jgi:4-hydroxy-tetrahydrodipicolinate reductase